MSYVRFGSPTTYVTASAATDLWTAPSVHGLSIGQAIFFYDVTDPTGTGVNMPSPLINATTYYVASSGFTTTAFKVAYTVGGAAVDLLTNSGSPGLWLFYDTSGGGTLGGYAPNYLVVPCRTGAGVNVNVIDAALRGRTFKPQPFLTFLDFVAIDEVFLPDGFVGTAYSTTEDFTDVATVVLTSGTLPAGLALTQATSDSYTISGTPTTIGTSDFTLRITRGTYLIDMVCHITINAASSSGEVGGVGGG